MDDELDGVLFRFWIRAASSRYGWPGDAARAIARCHTPDEYRAALLSLAKEKGVNLPLEKEEQKCSDCRHAPEQPGSFESL